MSTFSDFSDAVSAALTAALGAVTFAAGRPPDSLPPASVALGFIWVTDVNQDTNNQLIEEITAMVRIYPIQTEQFDGATPIDPSGLYDAAQTIQNTLAVTVPPVSGHPWFYDVLNITFDHDNQFIDAEIQGTTWNDSAIM